jgi:hypothetical protein
MLLGKGCMMARSSKQKINTKSSAEAEFVALTDSATAALHARQFAIAQGVGVRAATVLQDNEAAITLAKKGYASSHRSRHIDIKRFWITDRVQRGDLMIEYVPTEEMIADVLTKPMSGSKFEYFRKLLLN